MKKTVLLILALLGAFTGVRGENNVRHNNPDNQSFFGIRASLDIPCPKIKDGDVIGVKAGDYKKGVGVELKGIYNIQLVSDFYVEPGFGLYYDTYKDDSFKVSDTEKGDASVRTFGLRVPVMFGYHFDFNPDLSLAIFTGPMLDVGIDSKYHVSYTDEGKSFSESISLYKDGLLKRENRADLKWMFGLGLTMSRSYYIGITGGFGMINIYKNVPKLHENLVQVSLGYNF